MQGLALQEERGGDPVVRKGTAGKTVKLTANYVRLEVEGEMGMYEYEIRFDPLVDSRDERFKLVGQQRELLGPTWTLDGMFLYIPHLLDKVVTVVKGTHTVDQSEVTINITLKLNRNFNTILTVHGRLNFEKEMKLKLSFFKETIKL